MLIEHISVSRAQCFETCHKQYYYKYHLKMVPEITPIYFKYGSLIHKIIENYNKSEDKNITQVIKEEIKYNSIPKEYIEVFPEHIRNLMKLQNSIGNDGEIEWKFSYDLDPPNNKTITGFIDRLIIKNNNAFIVDYKTTKKGSSFRKTRKNIHEDLQLRCYCRVVQKNFNIPAENIKAALYFLDGGELVSASFNEEILNKTEEYFLEIYNKISEMCPDLVVGNVGNHCYHCGFKKICPYYNTI